MRNQLAIFFSIVFIMILTTGCQNSKSDDMNNQQTKKILFLHHSTGKNIWQGGNSFVTKVKGKLGLKGGVEKWFRRYNKKNGTSYLIQDKEFPKKSPYGWKNYPYDYYNIWVKNGDRDYYMEEPTLKTLAPEYDVIIFKHCFPASKIVFDGEPDIDSDRKMVENYKMQYQALQEELLKYPDTKFILWTPPALTKAITNPEAAQAATDFSNWVVNEWDKPGDNIFVWDFRVLETEGGNYLLPKNASGEKDPHPSHSFSRTVYPLFCQRIVDVLESNGDTGNVTGR
ncbi:hypothetical protein DDZ16_12040 [Marinilabilia rubra]|uniref:SGNH/GDSL hydrolase family protein n=2 Tax=Marinilabilia rubra TaxID=2162893 RepID=A0A2U2B7F1_9BACT|nr:hypothetical protein DDZ16_12040 [Marinilabilia rubra]